MVLEVGTQFKSKEELKRACQTLATRHNFEYSVLKSDRSRLILKCIGEGCPWRLHASKVVDGDDSSFQVKTLHAEHNCLGVHHLRHHQASAKFIGEHIQAKVNDTSSYHQVSIKHDIYREYGIQLTYKQAHRAKQRALEAINGTEEELFAAMSNIVKTSNTIIWAVPLYSNVWKRKEIKVRPQFSHVFICYGASAIGFGFCCPVLGLDGTHLKSKYRGTIMTFAANNT